MANLRFHESNCLDAESFPVTTISGSNGDPLQKIFGYTDIRYICETFYMLVAILINAKASRYFSLYFKLYAKPVLGWSNKTQNINFIHPNVLSLLQNTLHLERYTSSNEQ